MWNEKINSMLSHKAFLCVHIFSVLSFMPQIHWKKYIKINVQKKRIFHTPTLKRGAGNSSWVNECGMVFGVRWGNLSWWRYGALIRKSLSIHRLLGFSIILKSIKIYGIFIVFIPGAGFSGIHGEYPRGYSW